MRISIWIVVLAAVLALGVVVVAGQALVQPNLPLITDAGFSLNTITPNADGNADIAEFTYTVSRNAQVSLYLIGENGDRYDFRQNETRGADSYSVLFSGVVDGFSLEGDNITGEVLRRLMPNGQYDWHLEARDSQTGEEAEKTGTLIIQDGGSQLPEMLNFSVTPNIFTPNQDGISDHTFINLYLTKDAELTVYLEAANGQQIFIPETQECRKPGEPGRHCFDYDGGIDLGVEPPPDGTYTIVATAQDAEGQRMQQTAELSIQSGGDPQAEIVPQSNTVDVVFAVVPYEDRYLTTAEQTGDPVSMPENSVDLGFSRITMPVGDMLVFKLTVDNYGTVPIRTSGPWPGTVYQQDQIWGAMGVYEESGSWRVGIQCATTTTSFPWRWSVGAPDTLETATDPVTGKPYYYLPAGEKSVVWGAVRMTNLIKARNPQQCSAGLIHEDVEVSVRNANVGARDIELLAATTADGG